MKTFLAILIASTGLIFAQDTEVHVWPAQGDIYMIVGAGGNITVQAGKDGVLVVDTGLADMSDKVLAAIKTISTGPIRYIINTSYKPEFTGGNVKIRQAGSTITGGNVAGDIKDRSAFTGVLDISCDIAASDGTTSLLIFTLPPVKIRQAGVPSLAAMSQEIC